MVEERVPSPAPSHPGAEQPRTLRRRSFLALGAAGAALPFWTAASSVARPAPLRLGIATNEPWGTYHAAPIVDDIAQIGGSIVQLVPDLSQVVAGDPVRSVDVATISPNDLDLIVVNGATDWPAEVVEGLPNVPVVASSLAYMTPALAEHAAELRPRLVRATAGGEAEAEVFAQHLGIRTQSIHLVGTPELDDVPVRRPDPNTVLIVTSVTHPDATGSSAPGTELLLETAHQLKKLGKTVIVGLHPREDASLWSNFDVAAEGTLAASARAAVAVGIPGSVFPKIAAVGTPLVGITAPGLTVPEYILALCTPASDVDSALKAIGSQPSVDKAALRRAVGPIGHAGPHLVQQWFAAAQGNHGR